MKTRIRARTGTPALLKGVRDVVQAPAQSMDLSIEVWKGPGQATDRLNLSSACADCQINQTRSFDRCRKRRSYLSRPEARVPASFSESCPVKMRLTRVASHADEDTTVVFGFGYAAEPSEDEADASVISFLEDVQLMLREPLENLPQLCNLSRARGARAESIDLLHVPPGKRSDSAQGNQALLDQWSAVLGADLAFAWVRERDIVVVSGAHATGLQEEVRTALDLFARRQAEDLLRSDRDWQLTTLPQQHPIGRLLHGEVQAYSVLLQTAEQTNGMLCGLRSGSFPQYSTVESQLIQSLAQEMSLRWSNAELVQGLKRFLVNTVKTLVSAIEAKDSYTSGHSERVNIISMLLGNELDLELVDLESLYWGALLHDVGKIGMPEAILNKPSPLEQDEFRVVQEHPERGWRMLHSVPELSRAAEGIRFHHERWDGRGYPRGLVGDEIPVLSRIICVADAFDAIVSNRSYRKGQSPTRALEIIEECVGEQFDPEVVAALRRLLPLLEKHRWVLMSGQKTSFHY